MLLDVHVNSGEVNFEEEGHVDLVNSDEELANSFAKYFAAELPATGLGEVNSFAVRARLNLVPVASSRNNTNPNQ